MSVDAPWQRESQGSALEKVADVRANGEIIVVIQVCFTYLICLKDSQVRDAQYLKRLLLSIIKSCASLL